MTYQSVPVSSKGETLALHGWLPRQSAEAVVFYIHGTQSHAGWLFESGPLLAGKNVALYALDRRGAGQSSGARGHAVDFHDWLTDYLTACELVREKHPGLPLVCLGQSFGGAILAALAKTGKLNCTALAFCAPALNQFRRRFNPPKERPALNSAHRVPIENEWYTTVPRYLEFIENDPLMLREVTFGTILERHRLEEFYSDSGRPWPAVPTALILPKSDRIIEIPLVRGCMEELTSGRLTVIEIPSSDHYLEFSNCRESYLAVLASYALTQGFTA